MTDRQSDHPIDQLFIQRWSPRAFSGAAIPEADLYTAFEAARWAPSSANFQPWRFVFAHRHSDCWPAFIALLNERNRLWADKAGAIVFFVAEKNINYGEKIFASPSHAFDSGAAWANFAHQAHLLGYGTRAIGGFDKKAAPVLLDVPDDFEVLIAVAIGVPDKADSLAATFQALEKPSLRRPLNSLVFEGRFAGASAIGEPR